MSRLDFGGLRALCAILGLGVAFAAGDRQAHAQGFYSGNLIGSAAAAATQIPSPPRDRDARAAFNVLDQHCAKCHQVGKLYQGAAGPSKGFGNILDLAALAENPDLVQPGNPDASLLLAKVVGGNIQGRRMPFSSYDKFSQPNGGPVPSSQQVAALRRWIEKLGRQRPGIAAAPPAQPDYARQQVAAARQLQAARPTIAPPRGAAVQSALLAPPGPAADLPQPPAVGTKAHAAFKVLDKHCARCHQVGKLNRKKPAKGLGNILDLQEIARNPKYIVPGNPEASPFYTLVKKQEMPYDVFQEFSGGDEPTEAEIASLRDWIQELGGQNNFACVNRNVVDSASVLDFVANDIERDRGGRNDFRYVTLTHLYSACDTDEQLKVYRQAVIKLLNSLSKKSDPLVLPDVDNNDANALAYTVLKFRLSDVGWSNNQWNELVKDYPYQLDPDKKRFNKFRRRNGTRIPMVRGDWLAFNASRPPHYHNLLDLPKKFSDLQDDLKVDVAKNLRNFVARRSGFQKSLVSQNNRLIERHPSNDGVFWTSYDFGSSSDKQNLFEHPLGPNLRNVGARVDGGNNAFEHDGGESIFSLPNGLNGYYLNNAKGNRVNTGPTNIVQDQNQKDLLVTNGISCMGCHVQGFRKASDDIRGHVLNDQSLFGRRVRDTVEKLYPQKAEMDRLIAKDTARFRDAMRRAGLDPDLTLDGREMINALSKRYERDVTLDVAASEFGLEQWEFVARTQGGDNTITRVSTLVERGTVPRDQFEAQFGDMMQEVFSRGSERRAVAALRQIRTDLQPRRADARAYAQARLARQIAVLSKKPARGWDDATKALAKAKSARQIAALAKRAAPGWGEARLAVTLAAVTKARLQVAAAEADEATDLPSGSYVPAATAALATQGDAQVLAARQRLRPIQRPRPASNGPRFAIQLATYGNRSRAEDGLIILRAEAPDLEGSGRKLIVVKDRFRDGRTAYLARHTGYADRETAKRTCRALMDRKVINDCYVVLARIDLASNN